MPPQEECRYANNENEKDPEMSSIKKMSHQSNGRNHVISELFSRQSTSGHGPLGLTLNKAPSVLDLVQKKLELDSNVQKTTVVQGMKPSKRMRASNFQGSVLKIGDWEFKSRYKGDLVAKFYFSKSKVVWEILQEGLKRKIEIKCSDISALEISCPKNLPGKLDIVVSVEPEFFRENHTLPYRSTIWFATMDFTGGQARKHRHVLQCDPGVMDKHIENLLSTDHHLYLLSLKNNINPESPCLGTGCSVPRIPLSSSNENSYRSDDGNLFVTAQTGESLQLHSLPTGTETVGLNDSGALQCVHFQSSEEPSRGSDQMKSDMYSWEEFFEMTKAARESFMSNGEVMNGKGNHINNVINSEDSHSRVDCSSRRAALPEVIMRFPCDGMTDQQVVSGNQPSRTDHIVLSPSSVTEEPSGQTLLQNQLSNGYILPETMALEQIRQNLLSDNEAVNVEEENLMSTVNSLSCLIVPATVVAPPPPPPPSDVEPTQVINVAPPESSSAGEQFPPWTEWPSSRCSPWRQSPEDVEMLESLSQLFP